MSDLKIGIIGCGRMGKERARSAAACGAQVSIVHDEDRERAQSLASQYAGCVVADQAAEVVRRNPQAIFVCSPPSARGPVELAAIAAGIPFFVEKPIGVTAAQAAPILEELDKTSLVHAVGYQNRCRSSVVHAKQVLEGRTILAISAFWAGRKYLVPWWLRSEDSGGPVNEQATHLIDLCRFLCGEIVELSSALGSAEGDASEPLSAALTLRFESGAFASLFYSCEANDKQIGLRIITKQGGLTLSSWDLALTQNEIDSTGITTHAEDIFVLETRQFLKAVRADDPTKVACTFDDAWRTQQMVDRIRASNRQYWMAQ